MYDQRCYDLAYAYLTEIEDLVDPEFSTECNALALAISDFIASQVEEIKSQHEEKKETNDQ